MKIDPHKLLELPLEERAIRAMRAAVRKAIAERRRQGLQVYVWLEGKVVELPARKRRSIRPKNLPKVV